jgi:hypothetical protein
MILLPAGSTQSAMKPGTSWRPSPKKAGIAELEWEHQRKQLLEAIDGESCDLLNLNSTLN